MKQLPAQKFQRISLIALLFSSAACTAGEPVPPLEIQPTIQVQGEGTVKFSPDRARVNFAIEARRKTVAEAQSEAARVSANVLELADRLDIPRERIDTTGATVRPHYQYNRTQEKQELVGYIATRQMIVELHDLEELGTLIEGGVEAGVNQVSPPTTFSSKQREHYRDALEAAALDARANAQRLAHTLDVKLGKAISINASPFTPAPMPRVMARGMAAEAMADGAAQTYNVGDAETMTTVNVVFAIH